jgi:hypothetical protein
MQEQYPGKEKREFFRYKYDKPVYYQNITPSLGGAAGKYIKAASKNLSASGLLFTTELVPELSGIVMIKLDYRTSQICREIESKVFMIDHRIVGKVVRIEDAGNGFYDVGIAFIKKSKSIPAQLMSLVKA